MRVVKSLFLAFLCFLLTISFFSIVFTVTLKSTVLDPQFIISQIEKLDVYSIAREELVEQISTEDPDAARIVEETFIDLEPWLKDQVDHVIYTAYAYFKGEQANLNLIISLGGLKETVKANLVEHDLDEICEEVDEIIPDEFELSESVLDVQVRDQIEVVRTMVGYFYLASTALLWFAAFIILLIALVSRSIKDISRKVGIAGFSTGAVCCLMYMVATRTAPSQLERIPDIPAQLQQNLPGLIGDLLTPMQTMGIGFMVGGAVLIAVSFIYKGHKPASAA